MFELYFILSGVLSPADPGVLEKVAQTRSTYFDQVHSYRSYDVLVAVEDCRLLERTGWLITDRGIHTCIVVDCSQEAHSMNGIMADTNLRKRGNGWLILDRENR